MWSLQGRQPASARSRQAADIQQEAEAKEVGLFDDDPNALEAVLRFLYGQTNAIEVVHYQNLNSTVLSGSDLGCMEIGAQVYVVADKYGVSGLKFKVLEYMRPLPGFCTVSARDLVAAIGIIWTSTSDNDALARPLLIHTCAEHFEKFINEEGFEQTLRQHGLEIDICRILAVSSYPGCGKPCCWS